MDAVLTLFIFILLSIVLALANLERFHEAFRWAAIVAIVLLNLLLITLGLAGLAIPMAVVPGLSPSATNAMSAFLRAMGITGLFGSFRCRRCAVCSPGICISTPVRWCIP